MYQNRPSILYIHGLDSGPLAEKTSIIAEMGCTVIAPKIHYRESKNTYQRLLQLAKEFDVDCLIGSSLGGYTAFWLSQELNIPTLLFNPALAFQSIDPGLIEKSKSITNFQQTIFLGMKDETVNPNSTKAWLEKNGILDKVKIIEHPTNGHQISLPIFKENIYEIIQDLVPQETF